MSARRAQCGNRPGLERQSPERRRGHARRQASTRATSTAPQAARISIRRGQHHRRFTPQRLGGQHRRASIDKRGRNRWLSCSARGGPPGGDPGAACCSSCVGAVGYVMMKLRRRRTSASSSGAHSARGMRGSCSFAKARQRRVVGCDLEIGEMRRDSDAER